MKPLTKEIIKSLPKLRANENKTADKVIIKVKFFGLGRLDGWRWYATEYDGENIFFGFITSPMLPAGELGYFTLSEFKQINADFAEKKDYAWIERDLYWPKMTLKEVMNHAARGYYC